MATRKISTQYPIGTNLYAFIWDVDEEKIAYLSGEVFEGYGTGGHDAADYAITLAEKGGGRYSADWPSWIPVGLYDIVIKIRGGATPDDDDIGYGPSRKRWDGVSLVEEEAAEQNAVEICNLALAKIGGAANTVIITTIDPDTLEDTDPIKPTVQLCALIYPHSRKEVLKRMRPQECRYYADLGAESSFSGEKAEWEYCFDLPDDCLLFLKQTHESCYTMEYAHEIKQRRLFTNILTNDDGDSAYIEYVKNETDATIFSSEVVKAIATLLAAELCPRIIGGEWAWRRRQDLLSEFERIVLPTSAGINNSQQYQSEDLWDVNYSWLGDRQ